MNYSTGRLRCYGLDARNNWCCIDIEVSHLEASDQQSLSNVSYENVSLRELGILFSIKFPSGFIINYPDDLNEDIEEQVL